jgi:hypothetical protein
MKKIYLIVAGLLFLAGCYTETIEELSSFKVQVPVYFYSESYGKASPDTSIDFSNLNEYDTYRENRDRVNKAEVYQFNYWIDSLILEDGTPYNPDEDSLVIDRLVFSLKFALPLGDPNSTNPNDFIPDPDSEVYILGEYENVNISEYWRNPEYIKSIDEDIAVVISETLKDKPHFYLYTESGRINGRSETVFPYIKSRFDLVVRLDVKL